jgi:hypothetical protein
MGKYLDILARAELYERNEINEKPLLAVVPMCLRTTVRIPLFV